MIPWALAATLAWAPPPATTGVELARLLDGPAAPGAVGLLVAHAGDARAAARIASALSAPEAAVRAAAARVANVAGLGGLAADVERALLAETDAAAARELMRALVALGGPSRDAAVVAQARRLALAESAAEALARARGPGALAHLSALREAGMPPRALGLFFGLATRDAREGFGPAAAIMIREGLSDEWRGLLSDAHASGIAVDEGLLVAAARSTNPALRAATWWHLARVVQPDTPLAPALEAAASASPDRTSHPEADPDAALGLEVLRRVTGAPASEDWEQQVARIRVPPTVLGQVRSRLTRKERRALSLAATRGKSGDRYERDERVRAPGHGRSARMRIVQGLPPGLPDAILAAAGCDPGARLTASAVVEYAIDGRPRQMRPADLPSSPGCAAAGQAILALTVSGPEHRAAPDTVYLLARMGRDEWACVEPPWTGDAEQGHEDADLRITEPRKVRHVSPRYPGAAQSARVQGPVVIEATISRAGCMTTLEVVRSASPLLDAAALGAVALWRYTPAQVGGRPVPTLMTVTVNFRLGR